MIETVRGPDNEVLSIIIRSSFSPENTTFLTPPEYKQQVGFIVYPRGGEVKRHVHIDLERNLVGTSEVIIIKSGSCILDIYTITGQLVASKKLERGDLMLMVGGGHGFRMLEDTVLLEVKQGPYTGIDEKRHF
jgi:hypothetical protein